MAIESSESGTVADAITAALREAPFAALKASGAPLLVAVGHPPHVVWTNAAAAALFGGDAAAVAGRLFSGAEPGAKRLAELARSLPPGGAPRLEKLRFFRARRAELLTVLCRRTSGPQPLFLVAVPGLRAPAQPAAGVSPDPQASLLPDPPANVLPEPDAIPHAQGEPVQPAPPPAPPARPAPVMPALRSLEAVRADLAQRFGGAATIRFLWQTDADHRFVKITGELCEAVGCDSSQLIGRSFGDIADELGLDPDVRLRDSLARGETWSNVDVLWPVAGADAALPILLGALPSHDRERRFDGFRGFGVIHVSRVEGRPPREPDVPPPQHDVAPEPEADAHAGPVGSAPPPPVDPEPAPVVETPAPERDAREPAATGAAGNVVTLRPFHVVPRRPAAGAAEPAATPLPDEPRDSGPGAPEADPEPAAKTPARPPRADDMVSLSASERLAFREIARALGARPPETPPKQDAVAEAAGDGETTARDRMRDLIEVATRVAQEAAQAGGVAPEAPAASEPPPSAPAALSAQADVVLDRLPIGVLVSRDGETLYINRTMLDIAGYADEREFRDDNGLSALFKGRPAEALGEGANGGAIPVMTRGGDIVALEAHMHRIDWAGAPASMMTFRRTQENDLAYRVRTLETELRASEASARELHAILDTATDGVAVLDEDGKVLALNRAGEALFGFEQNEVAGESFTIFFAKESQAAALDYLAGLRTSGVASVLNDGRDVIGRARQGGSIPLFMTLGRVGAAGKPKFCAVLRDMTSWKKAERELREARREAEHASAMKSDFLAKVSHEIRTPLNAILGFAEVIMEERFGPVGNDRYKDYLKDIHASGSHVMSLVNDLLDLSKIEAGKLELNFGSVDANRIVSECVSLIQPQAARERVIVRLSLAPRLPNIVADERALRQIVLNLLSNAVKFNEPGGQVIVSTALTDAGHAVIRIRDTGIGMSESDIETALEPFRQVATARHTTGTGLGLPLTKALVEANRASFTIKSKKAEGTLVEVAFPPTRVLAE